MHGKSVSNIEFLFPSGVDLGKDNKFLVDYWCQEEGADQVGEGVEELPAMIHQQMIEEGQELQQNMMTLH